MTKRNMEEKREQLFIAAVESSDDAIITKSLDGVITSWNRAAQQLFGFTSQEAIGQSIDIIVPAELRSEVRRTLDHIRRGQKVDHHDTVRMAKDGRRINISLSVSPVRSRSGVIVARAAEEQLKQAQKMESVGQLTGGIAHDFNNMLTVITGTIEILAEAVADRPQLAAIAKLIGDAAERGAALTARLLAFARKQPLQPREIDVNELIMEAATLLQPALGEQIEIKRILKSDVSSALVDPGQLSSALVNLAINARDSMPDGGRLTIETSDVTFEQDEIKADNDVDPGSYVLIAVSDTGTGIPKATRRRGVNVRRSRCCSHISSASCVSTGSG